MALVYKITNEINGKVYIGQTSRTLHERWLEHTAPSRKLFPLHMAMQKYGIEAFKIEEVFNSDNLDEILTKEKELILQYNSYNKGGYNATFGEDGGNHTPKVRAKISASKMGHTVSKETRKKLSDHNMCKWKIKYISGEEEIITDSISFCKDNKISRTQFYRYRIKRLNILNISKESS